MYVSLTGDLYLGHVGRVFVHVCFPDRRPVFGSCRQGFCMCVCVYVCVCFPDRRPVFGSCRQGLCMCVCVSLTGDVYSGRVGRDCVCMYVCVTGDLYSGHVGRVCVCMFP